MNNEQVLIESKSFRSQYYDKVDVLDKAGQLAMLPGGTWTTIAGAAEFFGVAPDAIESVIKRHREELEENGLVTLRGSELKDLKAQVNDPSATLTEASLIPAKTSQFTVLPRKAVLNIAMLLTES